MTNATRTVDVKAFIDAQRFSLSQWVILILCFCIVTADGYDAAAIGFIAPALTQDWGIPRTELGVVMSAALVGLGLGSVLGGPIADRIGRKSVLVVSVACFGVWTLIAANSHTVFSLTVFRLLTGLGLGAAMPNTVALMSEYAPERLRSMTVNVMYCGFSVGLIAGGAASAWLIPHVGWQSILVIGGAVPIFLSFVLLVFLPESVQFLAVRHGTREKIERILKRIAPHASLENCHFVASSASASKATGRAALALILSRDYRARTFLLWTAYFTSLIVYYLLTNWMPTLFRDLGFSTEHSMLIASLFPLGGLIGNPVTGWLMDRVNANRTIVYAYVLVAVLVVLIGQSVGNELALGVLIFLCGALATSASTSLSAYAAQIYPTEGRSTGVAWMQGVGRFGGVAGSFAGAALLGLGWHLGDVFTLLAVPALISAASIFSINQNKLVELETQS
ncbi:MFS transporter [Paraburkholderia unamae]|uniref:MFS transporter n=1 Tax=Paraburkholderia unamae TaxID=219649 RepID=UPI000DC31E9B|nr:MFS transporter [Paraburkholderia unamae]RAR67785.1 AAHS family 4-hydroxybenzoate transporter-like MFS transporter [Paraburkholderia unamae]